MASKRTKFRVLPLAVVAFAVSPCLLASAHADDRRWDKNCGAAKVNLLSAGSGAGLWFMMPYSTPPLVAIGTTVAPGSEAGVGSEDIAFIAAIGPAIDERYSKEMETDISCTDKGFLVTAILTLQEIDRLRNSPWRPKIELVAAPLRADVSVDVKWQVRLGKYLAGKSIGDFPELRKFPITVSKTIN